MKQVNLGESSDPLTCLSTDTIIKNSINYILKTLANYHKVIKQSHLIKLPHLLLSYLLSNILPIRRKTEMNGHITNWQNG